MMTARCDIYGAPATFAISRLHSLRRFLCYDADVMNSGGAFHHLLFMPRSITRTTVLHP